MKKYIAIILVSIIFLTSSKIALAQKAGDLKKMPPTQKAQIITDSLKNILKLSDVQYHKVYELTLESIKKAAPVIQSNDGRMSKGWQLRSILNSTEDKLKLVLTNKQFESYKNEKEKTIAYYRKQADEDDFHF